MLVLIIKIVNKFVFIQICCSKAGELDRRGTFLRRYSQDLGVSSKPRCPENDSDIFYRKTNMPLNVVPRSLDHEPSIRKGTHSGADVDGP